MKKRVALISNICHHFFVGTDADTLKVMKGLMLHCGAHKVEYDQVQQSDTPEATRTHTPIPIPTSLI